MQPSSAASNACHRPSCPAQRCEPSHGRSEHIGGSKCGAPHGRGLEKETALPGFREWLANPRSTHGVFREFELDGPGGLFLDDRCALPQSAADAQIVNFQAGEIAAANFAVDRQIEHCEVAFARLDLELSADVPNFLRLEWALLTDEPPLVPRRMLVVLLLGLGLGLGMGHGGCLPIQPLPPRLPASPLHARPRVTPSKRRSGSQRPTRVVRNQCPPAARSHKRELAPAEGTCVFDGVQTFSAAPQAAFPFGAGAR